MPFSIGVYLSPAKLLKPEFLALKAEVAAAGGEVELHVIDIFNLTATTDGIDFDVILHKVTDDLVFESDSYTREAIRSYEEWYGKEGIPVVDALGPQRLVIDRAALDETLSSNAQLQSALADIDVGVYIPKIVAVPQRLLDEAEAEAKCGEFREWVRECGVAFPMICKTAQACGCTASHSMAVVSDPDAAYGALVSISREYVDEMRNANGNRGIHIAESIVSGTSVNPAVSVVMQEFITHGSIVHKVYVLGKSVWVQQRGSLPDADEISSGDLRFHSHRMDSVCSHQQKISPSLPQVAVERVAEALGSCLQMSIFGFDVLIDQESGRMAVIDVNYFPGFKGVDGFPRILVDFLRVRGKKR